MEPEEESPREATITVEHPVAPETAGEETALAAGLALSESGHAAETAADAHAIAAQASEEAEQAASAAVQATAEASQAAAVAETADEKINRLFELVEPMYTDFTARREAETATPEVSEVDAAGSGGTSGGAPGGDSSGGGATDSDRGHDAGTTRRGLRHRRR